MYYRLYYIIILIVLLNKWVYKQFVQMNTDFAQLNKWAQKREHRCSRTSIDGHYNIVFLSLHISSSVTDTTLRPSSSKTFLQNERSAT